MKYLTENEMIVKIFHTIKGHYFTNDCNHTDYNECCRYLVGEIMAIIDYDERCKKFNKGIGEYFAV